MSAFAALTRRAKHRQNGIIDMSLVRPAREPPPRVFFWALRSANAGGSPHGVGELLERKRLPDHWQAPAPRLAPR